METGTLLIIKFRTRTQRIIELYMAEFCLDITSTFHENYFPLLDHKSPLLCSYWIILKKCRTEQEIIKVSWSISSESSVSEQLNLNTINKNTSSNNTNIPDLLFKNLRNEVSSLK